jgi:hypothetical protein
MWNHDAVDEYDGFEPTWELQAQVNADLQLLAAYGEHHPDEYGGCWLQDQHLYGVSFTESIGDHTIELKALLGLPERLRIRQCSHALRELRETAQAIVHAEMRHAPDGSVDITEVVGVASRMKDNLVEVYVLPGHPEVEGRLRATYGALISVVPGAVAQAF